MELATTPDSSSDAAFPASLRDPTELGFPPLLPLELALRIDKPEKICAVYGITRDQFAEIVKHPVFVKAYHEVAESLKVDGMSFKLKCKMISEDTLKTVYGMIQNPNISDPVRADLMKAVTRWAGYDAKANDTAGAGGQFNIQINLG